MYCYKFPKDIDKLLDGRKIYYVAKEVGIGRERMSNVLRGLDCCEEEVVKRIIDRFKPNCAITDYFRKASESEARDFNAKRNM